MGVLPTSGNGVYVFLARCFGVGILKKDLRSSVNQRESSNIMRVKNKWNMITKKEITNDKSEKDFYLLFSQVKKKEKW